MAEHAIFFQLVIATIPYATLAQPIKSKLQLAKLLLLPTVLAEQCISISMVTLHFTEPKLAVKLEKTYKPTNRNNPPTSTYTASTLHIAIEPSDQPTTIAPSPTQPKSQQ